MIAALGVLSTIAGWIGWLGIGLVPLAIAAAVVVFLPPFRNLAIIGAAVWLAVFGAYTYGDSNGAARIRNAWDAADRAAVERGTTAREAAEREIELVETPTAPVVPTAPSARPVAPRVVIPSGMRNDPYNRDNR